MCNCTLRKDPPPVSYGCYVRQVMALSCHTSRSHAVKNTLRSLSSQILSLFYFIFLGNSNNKYCFVALQCVVTDCCFASVKSRAARLIECDSHVHLVSKAGSVISGKSPSYAFRRSSIYYTEP